MLKTFFQSLLAWYLGALKSGGLPLVVLLMTMESSFLPLPSEVIIPPAAHLAWSGDGLNLFRLHLSLAGPNRPGHGRRVRFVAGRHGDVLGGARGGASPGVALRPAGVVSAGQTGKG